MLNKILVNRLSKISFLIFLALFLPFNSYAVKKSATEISNKQIEETKVVLTKKEKPSLAQRLGMKLLLKKLAKKTKKQSHNTRTEGSKLKKGMAIAALVLGIISFFASFVGIATAVLAIILGAIAKKRAKDNPEIYGGKKMANAGLILGITLLSLLVFIFGFIFITTSSFFFVF